MFYDNKNVLYTTYKLLINATEKLDLVNNIKEAFENINSKEILDKDTRDLVESIKTFSDNIYSKNIRDRNIARMYFDECNIDENIKSIITAEFNLSDSLIQSYINYYAKFTHSLSLINQMEKTSKYITDFELSGIDDVEKNANKMLESVSQLKEIADKVENSIAKKDLFSFSVNEEFKSMNTDSLEDELYTTEKNRIFTGTFIDNLTAGFVGGNLYIGAAASGRGKTMFLHNVVERIATHMKPEDFKVPSGMVPCILYVNLEMTKHQIIRRRASYFDESQEDILFGKGDEDNSKLEERMVNMLKKHNSNIEIIFQQGKRAEYGTTSLKTDITRLESMGRKVVFVALDYLNLSKYEPYAEDVRENDMTLTIKARRFKAFAEEHNLPVVTLAQLNGQGTTVVSEGLLKAQYDDFVKRLEPGTHLARASFLIDEVDMLSFLSLFSVPEEDYDFFSITTFKDRDNVSRYIDKDGKAIRNKRTGKYDNGNVMYCAKMEGNPEDGGYRISNNYEASIRGFIQDTEGDSINAMTVEAKDL